MGCGFKATQVFNIESRCLQAVVGLSPQKPCLRDGSGFEIEKPWAAKSQAEKSLPCIVLAGAESDEYPPSASMVIHYMAANMPTRLHLWRLINSYCQAN